MGNAKLKIAGILVTISILAGCSQSEPPATSEASLELQDYAASPLLSKTLPELSEALSNGDITSEALTNAYLKRISAIDRAGPRLQSVIAINPDALEQARAIDKQRADGQSLPPLAGIPVVLKDNIETLDDMPTTAGALVLANNMTGRDSPLTAGLRSQGAIILGKTNLSQWANFRSERSISGWTALGGQVHNPHMLDRSPCGSSSGSGAAIAASLASGAVGTETNGSIICPSNVNGVVGFKPTVGLVSQKYIVPISVTQDTAGPMTKTVMGAAMMLSAMATDENGNVLGQDYAASLDAEALKGKRVGVMRFAEGSNPDIKDRFHAALEVLEAQGAELVDIAEFERDTENYGQKSYSVLLYEFKDGLNSYLSEAPESVTARTLENVIAFNQENAAFELSVFDQSIFDLAQAKGPLTDEDYLTAREDILRTARKMGVDKLMIDNNVDVIVGPSGPVAPRIDPINGDVWPDWAGAGWMAAVAGYPHLTVPMGDVHGVPIGLSFMGRAGQDADILAYGYDYELASQMRRDPQYLKSAEQRPEIKKAVEVQ